jgi:hypothetical protein
MRTLAFARHGDQTSIIEYYTEDGFHVFHHFGERSFVPESPAIQPVHLTDLGDFLPSESVGKMLRRRVDDAYAEVASRGASIRFFEQLESGWMELPIGNIARGWSSWWSEITSRAVEYQSNGQPTKREGAVAELENDLKRLGLEANHAPAIVENAYRIQKAGHAESFVRTTVLGFLNAATEDLTLLVPVAIYCLYLGLELGANSPLGELLRSANRDYVMLGMFAAVGGWFAYRRMRSQ